MWMKDTDDVEDKDDMTVEKRHLMIMTMNERQQRPQSMMDISRVT
jgi:hypothetical protein